MKFAMFGTGDLIVDDGNGLAPAFLEQGHDTALAFPPIDEVARICLRRIPVELEDVIPGREHPGREVEADLVKKLDGHGAPGLPCYERTIFHDEGDAQGQNGRRPENDGQRECDHVGEVLWTPEALRIRAADDQIRPWAGWGKRSPHGNRQASDLINELLEMSCQLTPCSVRRGLQRARQPT